MILYYNNYVAFNNPKAFLQFDCFIHNTIKIICNFHTVEAGPDAGRVICNFLELIFDIASFV